MHNKCQLGNYGEGRVHRYESRFLNKTGLWRKKHESDTALICLPRGHRADPSKRLQNQGQKQGSLPRGLSPLLPRLRPAQGCTEQALGEVSRPGPQAAAETPQLRSRLEREPRGYTPERGSLGLPLTLAIKPPFEKCRVHTTQPRHRPQMPQRPTSDTPGCLPSVSSKSPYRSIARNAKTQSARFHPQDTARPGGTPAPFTNPGIALP